MVDFKAALERSREVDTTDWRYILKHENDYVESVTGTGHDAAPTYFAFTKDRAKAKVFTYQDLYWKQAVNPIGIEFTRGFSRGEVLRVDNLGGGGQGAPGEHAKKASATVETTPAAQTPTSETAYERNVRESSPKGVLDPDLAQFARDLIAAKAPAKEALTNALVQLRAHKPVVGRSKLIVELCLKMGEE